MTSSIAPSVSQAWGSFASVVDRSSTATPSVTLVDAPSGITQPIVAVTGLTMETFESWTLTSQAFYLRLHGSQTLTDSRPATGPVSYSVALGPDGMPRKRPAASTDTADWRQPPSGATALVAEPEKLAISDFYSWSTRNQAAYIKAANRSNGGAIELKGTDGQYRQFQEDQFNHVKGAAVGLQPTPGQTINLGSEQASPTGSPNAPQGVDLGVIAYRPTTDDTLTDIPYYHLPGSSSGNNGALIKAGADALFPTLDGAAADRVLPASEKPEGYDTDPATLTTRAAVETFMALYKTWHSAYQTQWILENTPTAASTTTDNNIRTIVTAGLLEFPPLQLDLTTNTYTQIPSVSLFVSTGDAANTDPYRRTFRPINIATISKEQIGILNAADQARVAASIQFQTVRQTDLGLVGVTLTKPAGWETGRAMTPIGTGDGATVYNSIQTLINTISGSLRTIANGGTADDSLVFVDQLKLLRTQIDGAITGASGAAFIDKAKVEAQIKEIETRYKRAKAYFDSGYGANKQDDMPVYYGALPLTTPVPGNVVSLDDGALIRSGYDTFIAQEKRVLQYAANRYEVANGTLPAEFEGKPFDAPTLIYYLQNKYNQTLEAEVTIETEAVKQLNAYLKDYAEFQDWVQQTMGSFTNDQIKDGGAALGLAYKGATDTVDKRRQLFVDFRSSSASDKTKRLFKLAMMFEDSNGLGTNIGVPNRALGYPKHPAEVAKDITRPDGFDIFKSSNAPTAESYQLAEHTYQEWQTYSTRLADKVTQLNQDSQQKMNDINNMDKQRNRHYDLANSALQKMNDALQSILRATG